MKFVKLIFCLLSIIVMRHANAQGVGINDNNADPHPSAILDATSSSKGVLIPRMTTQQRNGIESPAKGLQIYNTDCDHINVNVGTPQSPDWAVITASNSVIAAVNVSANPPGSICSGTPVTYTADVTNGGSSPGYTWFRNGSVIDGETGPTYSTSSLVSGDVIHSEITSNADCVVNSIARSNALTTLISPSVPTSVSIVHGAAPPICAGTILNFTATPVNGGALPGYQWKKNGADISGATGVSYTTNSYVDGDEFTCVLTSSEQCATGSPATSNAISLEVFPAVTAGVAISASPGSNVCAGANVLFTAVPTNGGSNPGYQWKMGGVDILGETSNTYETTALQNNDVITCVMTSDAPCVSGSPATSNQISMNVQAGGSGSATFSATGTGASGTIQSFTVPSCVTSITIEAWGAQGGNSGGLGARMRGNVSVTPGQVLKVLVGQAGAGGSNQGGGGGGSFVATNDNIPLVIAGGGAGRYNGYSGLDGVTAQNGVNSEGYGTTGNGGIWQDNGLGGTNGNGGASGTYGSSGGGGGFYTDGAHGINTTANVSATNGGGRSFLNGGSGGVGCAGNNDGGFGGGGGGSCSGHSSGGGGGYSGGGGASWTNTGYDGGGGGSYNSGTNQSNTAGVRSGNGQVVISW